MLDPTPIAIRSYLALDAEEAVAFVRKHMTNESIITGVRRVDHWSIPLVAVREALMNAVVHADYAQQGAPIRVAIFDARVEIENPGILPFGHQAMTARLPPTVGVFEPVFNGGIPSVGVDDIEGAVRHLEAHGVPILVAPSTRTGAR